MRGYLCCKNYGRDVLGAKVACEQNARWSWERIVWVGRTFVLWCCRGLSAWSPLLEGLGSPALRKASPPCPILLSQLTSCANTRVWWLLQWLQTDIVVFLSAVVIFLFSYLFLKLFSPVLFPLIAWHAELAINSQECPEHLTGEPYQTNKYKIKCRNNDL